MIPQNDPEAEGVCPYEPKQLLALLLKVQAEYPDIIGFCVRATDGSVVSFITEHPEEVLDGLTLH